jgi:hypothetical protein
MTETSVLAATPLAHFVERLRFSKLELKPYPHYYLENIFPQDYYQSLIRNLPGSGSYENLFEITDLKLDHFRHRDQRNLNDDWTARLAGDLKQFWDNFNSWFLGPDLADAVLNSFAEPLQARFGPRESWPEVSVESQLIRHRAGYFLGPHSDLYTKLIVLLIYLAPDHSAAHLGTSLYRPKDPAFTCANSTHYPFEDFVKVKTAPYKPNSMLAFVRSDVSFHGVEPLSDEDMANGARDLIQYVLHDKQVRIAQLEAKRLAATQKATA